MKNPAFAYDLSYGITVFDDLDADKISGGLGKDWFFINQAQEPVDDAEPGEVIN